MALEVEMKAHIDDAEAVGSRLCAAGFVPAGEVDKDDRYFRGGNGVEFRIRFRGAVADGVSSAAVVTHKKKNINDGVERNLEWEFEVSDASAFEALCDRMGCERFAVKRKRGSLYRRDRLLAEVVEVDRLGWFVEIECMVEEGDGEQAASQIRQTLDAIGVDPLDVESRTYLQLLGFER